MSLTVPVSSLYHCSNVSTPTSLSITSASFCSVLTVTAVAGNFLVLLAVIIDPNRNLRSPFNFLVANLAAADLIVGCFALPMSVDFYIRESLTAHHVTFLPRDHARRVGYFISTTASLLSLAALTVDRFNAITDPLKYRIRLSTKRVAIVSLVLWIVSTGLPFLYFQVGYLKYQFFFANTAVVATFTVLCLTYAKVFKTLKHKVKNCDALHGGNDRDNHAKLRAIKLEKKITKTFLIMLALFICCFLPSLILIYVIIFCGSCNCVFIQWAKDLNYILIAANSSMNPFVFAWRLQRYRRAFAKITRCGKING
ncbi:adenosine receptor A2a-like [Oculina patagonica]